MVSDEQAAQHHVLVAGDNEWQRDARLLQALWRERHDLPVGMHRGHPLGSRLAMPFAKDALAGFTSETVRNVVRAEVFDPLKSTGKLYEEPRIYDNLLTSQALCFNLFAELQKDRTSTSWTLEAVLEAVQGAGGEAWALDIRDRYLG